MSIANYNLRTSKQALTFTRKLKGVVGVVGIYRTFAFHGLLSKQNFSKINYFVFAEAQLMLTQELVYLMTGDSLAGMMDVNISGPEEC